MLTLCIPVVLVAYLAALGRAATPREERLPWARWTTRDLACNVAQGARRLIVLHDRSPVETFRRTEAER